MDSLLKNSSFLQSLFSSPPTAEEVKQLCPLIKNLDDVLDFYENKYKIFDDKRLIVILEDLNYLNCTRVIDIIIILKHRYIMSDYFYLDCFKVKLPKYLKLKYDKVEIKESIFISAIHHEAYELAKYYKDGVCQSDRHLVLENLIKNDNVPKFSIVCRILYPN